MTDFDLRSLLPKDKFEKKGRRYFLKSDLSDLSDFEYSGIYLGEDVDGKFYPSLMLLEQIKGSYGKIVVSKNNAWQFSLGKNLIEVVSSENASHISFVYTGNNEIVGVAVKEGNHYKNLWDVGHLLRREMSDKK